MIELKDWTQDEWSRAGQTVYHKPGDFFEAPGLMPTPDRKALQRAPAWSSLLTHSGLTDVRGAFYDYANSRYVLIGTDGSSQVASSYFDSSWTHVGSSSTLVAANTTLGGFSMQNVRYYGGYLWIIVDNGRVYRGSSYTAALTSFLTSSDARAMAGLGGRLYLVRDVILSRLDAADSAFETHYNPTPLETYPLALLPIRDGLAWFCRGRDSSLHLFHIPGYIAGSWIHHQDMVATLPNVKVSQPSSGSLFTNHEGDIYFSPGAYTQPDSTTALDIYRFNGTSIDKVAHIPDALASPAARGLTSWRGELLYYEPYSGDPNVRILVGDRFYSFLPDTASNPYTATSNPILASLAGELIISGDVSGTEGIHHAGSGAYADGYAASSWLHCDHPGQEKRLQRIAVHLDTATANTTLTLKYRTNGATSWTQAATQTAATPYLVADNIGVDFYTLQIRVDLADAATTQQIKILAWSVHYTIGAA